MLGLADPEENDPKLVGAGLGPEGAPYEGLGLLDPEGDDPKLVGVGLGPEELPEGASTS